MLPVPMHLGNLLTNLKHSTSTRLHGDAWYMDGVRDLKRSKLHVPVPTRKENGRRHASSVFCPCLTLLFLLALLNSLKALDSH
jgi:hypothetical protein